jgi:glutathione S-transferase
MLKLYDDTFSPYARKVRLVLDEKGIPYEKVRALHDCNRTDFLDVNPRAEVPALVDGDFPLYDSTVICEYLEERWPSPPVYPRDPRERARCRLIEDLADTQLDAAGYAIAIVEFGRKNAEPLPGLREATGRDLARLYAELEGRLGDRSYFCGDVSVADFAVFPHVASLSFLGFPLDGARTPRLAGWLARITERPAVERDNADVIETMGRLQAEGRDAFDPWRVQWRSDRLEWVMKQGFADWFMQEIAKGRAFFPVAPSS